MYFLQLYIFNINRITNQSTLVLNSILLFISVLTEFILYWLYYFHSSTFTKLSNIRAIFSCNNNIKNIVKTLDIIYIIIL